MIHTHTRTHVHTKSMFPKPGCPTFRSSGLTLFVHYTDPRFSCESQKHFKHVLGRGLDGNSSCIFIQLCAVYAAFCVGVSAVNKSRDEDCDCVGNHGFNQFLFSSSWYLHALEWNSLHAPPTLFDVSPEKQPLKLHPCLYWSCYYYYYYSWLLYNAILCC